MNAWSCHLRWWALPASLAVLMIGCASTPREADGERLARYQAHAGEPVSKIPYSPSRSRGFDVIDDEHLLLMQSPSRNWLVRVDPPCLAMGSSPYLLIDSQDNQLTTNFDAVISRSQPGMRCRIREIRPLDMNAVREEEKARKTSN